LTPGLSVHGLSAGYANRKVIHEIAFTAPRGQVTALLGPNGAGKSTLLKAVLGLRPCRGEVLLDGVALESMPARQRAQQVAYVPQQSLLAARLPVRSVVGMGRFAQRGAWSSHGERDREAIDAALAQADVAHLADRAFPEISGGERQRVLLARALATGARTLLLDEPTSSLDVRQVLSLHAVVRELAERDFCLVVVLHDLDEARHHADHGVLLAEGRVHSEGPIGEVVHADPIRRVYGVEVHEREGLAFRLPASRER